MRIITYYMRIITKPTEVLKSVLEETPRTFVLESVQDRENIQKKLDV